MSRESDIHTEYAADEEVQSIERVEEFKGRFHPLYIDAAAQENIIQGIYDEALDQLYQKIFAPPVDYIARQEGAGERLFEFLNSIYRAIYWATFLQRDDIAGNISLEAVHILKMYRKNLEAFYRIVLADPKFNNVLDESLKRGLDNVDFEQELKKPPYRTSNV